MSKVFNMVGGGGGPAASIFVTGLSETDTVTATNGSKTLTGKWTQIPNPDYIGLPDGYTQLEYIQSSGTQYIDTGISANSTNLTVECDGTSLGTGFTLFGVGGTYDFEVLPAPDKGFTRFNYCTSTVDISGGPYDGVFKMNRNMCYINGSLVHTFSSASWSVDNIWLFGRNRYGALDNSGASTIRYCKIWVADELVRHFIPCKNGEGTFGLYDLVNDVFYTNSGTGTFTAGAEVPQTFDGFLIKPIRDFGTWTVTATNGDKTATQDVLVDVITEYEIEMSYYYIGWYLEHKANANDTVSVTTSDNVIATVRIATTSSAYTYGHFKLYNADGTEYALKNGDEILFSYNQSYTSNGMNVTEAYIQYSSSKTQLLLRQNASNYLYTATSNDESMEGKFRIGLNSYGSGASSTISLTKFMLNGVNIPFKS